MDAWGSSEAWGAPDAPTAPAPASEASRPTPVTTSSGDAFGGWGAATTSKPAEPKVSADEDFGGWSSAPSVAANNTAGSGSGGAKPVGGFGGGTDDLFSNVWE